MAAARCCTHSNIQSASVHQYCVLFWPTPAMYWPSSVASVSLPLKGPCLWSMVHAGMPISLANSLMSDSRMAASAWNSAGAVMAAALPVTPVDCVWGRGGGGGGLR